MQNETIPPDFQKLAQTWNQVAVNQAIAIANLTADLTLLRSYLADAQNQLAQANTKLEELTAKDREPSTIDQLADAAESLSKEVDKLVDVAGRPMGSQRKTK
jgi:ABC-type transporter Mla subunit MlaD